MCQVVLPLNSIFCGAGGACGGAGGGVETPMIDGGGGEGGCQPQGSGGVGGGEIENSWGGVVER